MMKHMVAAMGITAQIRPMDGLYTASAVPTMNPPPTHVAVSHIHTNAQIETHTHTHTHTHTQRTVAARLAAVRAKLAHA